MPTSHKEWISGPLTWKWQCVKHHWGPKQWSQTRLETNTLTQGASAAKIPSIWPGCIWGNGVLPEPVNWQNFPYSQNMSSSSSCHKLLKAGNHISKGRDRCTCALGHMNFLNCKHAKNTGMLIKSTQIPTSNLLHVGKRSKIPRNSYIYWQDKLFQLFLILFMIDH